MLLVDRGSLLLLASDLVVLAYLLQRSAPKSVLPIHQVPMSVLLVASSLLGLA